MLKCSLLLCAFTTIVALGCTATNASSLPNGVTSLNESYEDWNLSCQAKGDKNSCSVTQRAFDRKTKQRFYSVEFQPQGSQTHGVVLLPFGLDLNRGMALIMDGLPIGDIYPFATCMPDGCIVPLDLDDGQLGLLEKSKKASLSFSTISGRTMKLPLSTNGLEKALLRAHTLVR